MPHSTRQPSPEIGLSTRTPAGYRVAEVLNGTDVTVTGRTDEVSGTLTAGGQTVTQASFTVDVASIAPELTVLVPRTRAAELSQYLTHLSRYRGRNDMLHALDRDHPVLYPGKLLHKLLHRHTSRFLNMP